MRFFAARDVRAAVSRVDIRVVREVHCVVRFMIKVRREAMVASSCVMDSGVEAEGDLNLIVCEECLVVQNCWRVGEVLEMEGS